MRILISLIALLVAAPAAAAPIAATCATLRDVVAAAAPGATVAVAGACTAPIAITGVVKAPSVTIDASAASFVGTVTLTRVSGLTWRGGSFDGGYVPGPINGVAYGLAVNDSDHVAVEAAVMRRYYRLGILLSAVSDARVTGNTLAQMGSDGIDVPLSRRVVIDGNACLDFAPYPAAHPDCIQAWSRPGTAPVSDLTITNNSAMGDLQGISLFDHVRVGTDGKSVGDGGYDRVTITGNVVVGGEPDAISLVNCRGACVVAGNIVRTMPGAAHQAHVAGSGPGWALGTNDVGALAHAKQ